MTAERCRSCGAAVRWVNTVHGQPMPLSPEPDPRRGNIIVCDTPALADYYATEPGRAVVLSDASAASRRDAGLPVWLSHFASCPAAAQHRKPKRKRVA